MTRTGSAALLCLLLSFFLVFTPDAACSGSSAETQSALEPVLALLHEGRFDQAEILLNRQSVRTSHARIEKAYLRSFILYWKLLYDPENQALKNRFEARLQVSIQTGESSLRESRNDPMALLYLGASHLLRAQLRAAESSVFSAAYEAKKARKLLLKSVKTGSSPAESSFGLGTYEYFAARLPAVLRGLRFLLFLPGGNRDKGLQLLEKAAEQSDLFRFEARVVLISVYADEEESLYDRALEHAADLIARENRAVTALYVTARLFLDLGRPAAALDLLEEALEVATARHDTSPSVLAAIRFQRGKAEFRRFVFGRGIRHLDEMTAVGDPVPTNLRTDARALLEIYRPLAGSGLEERLQKIRNQLLAGEHDPAARGFAVFASDPDLNWRIRRQVELLAGQASDLAGNRAAALNWYKEAAGEDAADLYLTRPFTMSDGF